MTNRNHKLDAPWLKDYDLQRLLEALQKDGATARIVGGAVRDGLLDLPLGDIDLAIDVTPEETLRLLKQADIKSVPTGIEHGTITAILNRKPYEVTTLRHDVETFGRKARVAFTDDWIADAERRDFTINALYIDADGHLFDPFGGAEDLQEGRVVFIGTPKDRIQEDYLRILRFFRFSARFAKGDFDSDGLSACHQFAEKLNTLSVERITDEFFKILTLANTARTLQLMKPELNEIFSGSLDYEALNALQSREDDFKAPTDTIRRLAALISEIDQLKMVRLSNRQATYLRTLLTLKKTPLQQKTLHTLLYKYGIEVVADLALLQVGERKETQRLLDLSQTWKQPDFPIGGEDLKRLGVNAGPKMGELLTQVENWWIKEHFQPNKGACLDYLKSLLDK